MEKTRVLNGWNLGAAVLALGAFCGCVAEQAPIPGETETASATTPDGGASGETKVGETKSDEPAEPEFVEKKADVGATGKGEYGVSSEQPMSIVTVPVSTYFKAQEAAVFRMQIPSAMNLFQASEGRYPNSEEEFMTKIIKANQIVLPELPEGDVYFYDVQTSELKIRSQKKN